VASLKSVVKLAVAAVDCRTLKVRLMSIQLTSLQKHTKTKKKLIKVKQIYWPGVALL